MQVVFIQEVPLQLGEHISTHFWEEGFDDKHLHIRAERIQGTLIEIDDLVWNH